MCLALCWVPSDVLKTALLPWEAHGWLEKKDDTGKVVCEQFRVSNGLTGRRQEPSQVRGAPAGFTGTVGLEGRHSYVGGGTEKAAPGRRAAGWKGTGGASAPNSESPGIAAVCYHLDWMRPGRRACTPCLAPSWGHESAPDGAIPSSSIKWRWWERSPCSGLVRTGPDRMPLCGSYSVSGLSVPMRSEIGSLSGRRALCCDKVASLISQRFVG